jgi:hypothetical protein
LLIISSTKPASIAMVEISILSRDWKRKAVSIMPTTTKTLCSSFLFLIRLSSLNSINLALFSLVTVIFLRKSR